MIAETCTAQQLRDGEAEAHISQLRKSACNVTTQRSKLKEKLLEIGTIIDTLQAVDELEVVATSLAAITNVCGRTNYF